MDTLPGYCAGSMITGETANRALRKAFRENNGQPLPIGFDTDDQGTFTPVGTYAMQLSSLMGEQVRPLPLDADWEEIPDSYKAHIMPTLQTYFNLAPWLNNETRFTVGQNVYTVGERIGLGLWLQQRTLYRKYKHRLKSRYFDIHETPAAARAHPPPKKSWGNRTQEEWEMLVDWWLDPKRMARSTTNAENRSKNKIITYQGRQSFVQGRNIHRVNNNNQNEDLLETWRRCHSKKDGTFETRENETAYNEMRALQEQVRAGLIPYMSSLEILQRVVPSDNRQNWAGRGRRLPGGGSTARRFTRGHAAEDYVTRDHMAEAMRETKAAQERARQAEAEAAAARQESAAAREAAAAAQAAVGTYGSYLQNFLSHYNSQGNPFSPPFPSVPIPTPFPPPGPYGFQASTFNPNNAYAGCYRPTFPNSITCPGTSSNYAMPPPDLNRYNTQNNPHLSQNDHIDNNDLNNNDDDSGDNNEAGNESGGDSGGEFFEE